MLINITIEKLYTHMTLYWQVANESKTHDEWLYRWGTVQEKLAGVWMVVNYDHEGLREEILDLLRDIEELKYIAFENQYNWDAFNG